MKRMTKFERIEAAIRGEQVDRVPISLWEHFHLRDRAPGQLAEVTLALHRKFDTDLIKLTPSGLYPIQDWGATIQFGKDDDSAPMPYRPTICSAEEWETLFRLDVTKGALRRELEMVHHVATGLEGATPFVMTIFSPLTIAHKLRMDMVSSGRVIDDLRQSPRQLHAGLAIICDVMRDYVTACLEAGASGFFFATQLASYDSLTRQEYEQFGAAYDLPILESLIDKSRIAMLHICGANVMFDLLFDYPVDAINWDDRGGGTSLSEARQTTEKALAGGLALDTLAHGTEEDVLREAHNSLAEAGRRGFILAPTCVIPGPTPDANLSAARQAVEETAIA